VVVVWNCLMKIRKSVGSKVAKGAPKIRHRAERGPVVAKGSVTYEVTKIDVAEALLKTAIRLFFEEHHPVPIYVLASAAREILTTVGDKIGVETVLHSLSKRSGKSVKQLARDAHSFAGFFKHADRDATATLTFAETEVDAVLAMACQDFGRVTGGMPVEAQIYEVWVYALAFAKVSDAPRAGQRLIKLAISQFPGVRTADRAKQKRIGLRVLNTLLNDPSLKMEYQTAVMDALRGKK
jgi:hypothetical protein